MKATFLANIGQGIINWEKPEAWHTYLKLFEGERVTVTIDKFREKKNRSLAQNSYYWAVPMAILSEHTGFTKQEIHNALKNHFLSEMKTIERKDGSEFPIMLSKSTTELTTAEFEVYMSAIRSWASLELSVYIPAPHETEFDYEIDAKTH